MNDDTQQPDVRWVPALVIESDTTPQQRSRNFATYLRLKDGQVSPRHGGHENGLSGFVYDVPIERLRIAPDSRSFSFRLEKGDECFHRLLHVIVDHFDSKCDADDEVAALTSRAQQLAMALADALYWLKPGLVDARPDEAARDRDRLSELLAQHAP